MSALHRKELAAVLDTLGDEMDRHYRWDTTPEEDLIATELRRWVDRLAELLDPGGP